MPTENVIPVAVHGFTWSAGLLALINLMLGGGLATAWIRTRPRMREIDKTAEAKLIDALSTRVDKLEASLVEQRDHYERKLEAIELNYEQDKRISRHELGNVKMRFRALVMLLKRLPDPPPMLVAILSDIEAMEAEQMKAEALEKGARIGGRVTPSPSSVEKAG